MLVITVYKDQIIVPILLFFCSVSVDSVLARHRKERHMYQIMPGTLSLSVLVLTSRRFLITVS